MSGRNIIQMRLRRPTTFSIPTGSKTHDDRQNGCDREEYARRGVVVFVRFLVCMAVGMVVSAAAGIAVMVMFVCLIMRSVGVLMSAATGIIMMVVFMSTGTGITVVVLMFIVMRMAVGVLVSAAAGLRAKSFCKTVFIQHRNSSLI